MSHQITSTDGLVLAAKPAWHGLGVVVETAPTPDEALKLAGLEWGVEQWELTASDSVHTCNVTTHVANIRTDNDALLGVVGKGYVPVQNRELAAFCQALRSADAGDGAGDGRASVAIESAGSIRGGKRVWFLIRGESIWVNPKDEVKPYLLVANGHDGSLSLTCQPTTIRVVCRNTLHASLAEGERNRTTIRFRHEGSMTDKLEEAKRALGLFTESRATFEKQVQSLDSKAMNREELQRFWLEVYTATVDEVPMNPVGTKETKRAEDCKRVLAQWAFSFDQELQAMRTHASAWTALNAVTGWFDHQRVVRAPSEPLRRDNRLYANWWGNNAAAKSKVLELALSR